MSRGASPVSANIAVVEVLGGRREDKWVGGEPEGVFAQDIAARLGMSAAGTPIAHDRR